ncbi:MAG: hypothetical protein RMX96_30600 [Nostoc sp. ChiSLP02]|nr:hypothetical protein [Nostoc sp. ChiSLP02]
MADDTANIIGKLKKLGEVMIDIEFPKDPSFKVSLLEIRGIRFLRLKPQYFVNSFSEVLK